MEHVQRITPEMVQAALENPNVARLFIPRFFLPCVVMEEEEQEEEELEESEDQAQ